MSSPSLGSRPYRLVFQCPGCGDFWFETRWLGFLSDLTDEEIHEEVGECPTCGTEATDPVGGRLYTEDEVDDEKSDEVHRPDD